MSVGLVQITLVGVTVYSPRNPTQRLAPFGEAELNLAGTRLVSFRPSERRRDLMLSQSIDISPLRGEPDGATKRYDPRNYTNQVTRNNTNDFRGRVRVPGYVLFRVISWIVHSVRLAQETRYYYFALQRLLSWREIYEL
jgi:hypothetical protein